MFGSAGSPLSSPVKPSDYYLILRDVRLGVADAGRLVV
jgi:hypothetical protein